MNDMEYDPKLTAPLEAISHHEEPAESPSSLNQTSGYKRRSNFNDPRRILPSQTYKGSSLWRKLVALLGLGAFSILGGLVITLIVGLLAIAAALILQAAIS